MDWITAVPTETLQLLARACRRSAMDVEQDLERLRWFVPRADVGRARQDIGGLWGLDRRMSAEVERRSKARDDA